MRYHVPLLIALATMAMTATPQAVAQQARIVDKPKSVDGRYGKHDEGWFFYRDPPEKVVTPALPDKPTPQLKQPSPAEHKVFSAAWLRDNLPKYRMAAIDNPTKDNIELYLYLQKLAMDKAEQFALAHRKYAAQNPAVDETIQNPVSGIARKAVVAQIEEKKDQLITQIKERAGIYYFFRSDCPYCHKQNPMLDILKRMTGLSVLPISLDGLPSQDGLLPDWRPDQGQAEYLQVTNTPTMYLVEPGGQVQLLSVGVRALPELKQRILELALDNKWISQVEYDTAMIGTPRRFMTDGLIDSEVENDPQKLLGVLREASVHGRTAADYDELGAIDASPWTPKRN